jgi:DNA repair exonuclease SbcCD nuclease subunit
MIIFAADMHLTPRAWTNRWAVEGDAFYALDQLFEFVKKQKKCSGLIFGGDTTDSNTPDASTLHHLSAFMSKMKVIEVPVYFINGQHDKGAYGYSILETYGGINFDQQIIHLEGKKYYGLSYRSRSDLLEALTEVPECDYLVMHCAFKHLLGFEGAWQVEGTDIPEYVSNVLVGDIHVKDVSKFGDLTVYSPSSGYACSSAEIGKPHGFYTITKESITHKGFKTRKFVTLSVDETSRDEVMEELTKLNKAASKEPLPPVVFIKISKEEEISFDKFDKVVIVRLDAALELVDVSDLSIDSVKGLSLKGSLPAAVNRKKDAKLYDFMEGLLDASDPSEYVNGYLKKAGVALIEK